MAVLWERLAGDTSRLAFKIAFEGDPDDGACSSLEEAASWGGFQLWVDGQNLCEHLEGADRIEYVHWHLLPLLEWLATNWDPLLHEERLPNRNAAPDAWASLAATQFPPVATESDEKQAEAWDRAWSEWWSRHALRACRSGGLFPDIIFRRWRDQVEVSWGQSPISGMPEGFRFVAEQGMHRSDPRSVAAALHAVVSEATVYLVSRLPSSHRLRTLNQRIERLRETKNTERLMWLAGLGVDVRSVRQGWHRISKVVAEFGDRAAEKLLTPREADPLVVGGSCDAALMFGSVSPQIGAEDVKVLARNLVELSRQNGDPTNLSKHVRSEPSTMEVAWHRGYRLAEEFLERLGRPAKGDVAIDIHAILKNLGIDTRDVQLGDVSIRGVSIAGPGHRPAILINRTHDANRSASGYRFSLAHELCHILHDRSAGIGLALASGPWAPRDVERRANAFAAMLLMPRSLIERARGGSTHETGRLEWVLDIARTLRTSIQATLPHLRNLGYIDEIAEERVQVEVQTRAGLQDEGE